MALPYVLPLDEGLFRIDTGFHRDDFDAAYLMVDDGRAAFIDTGTNFAVPRLLAALDDLGLARDAVDWVIPTHVHLDHAGGVGALMQALPAARALVHPRGARHMVDPAALYAGALAVYGQAEMDRAYGQLVPVAGHRVQASADGQTVQVGSRPLQVLDTPGHARHHHCLWDARSAGWFTGDTFGLSYREHDTARGPWVVASSTPVQFDPPALKQSIDRLLACQPRWMYLTHYGRVGDVQRLAGELRLQIDAMVTLGEAVRTTPERHGALVTGLQQLYRARMQDHGVIDLEGGLASLALDIELNAQGLGVWLDRGQG